MKEGKKITWQKKAKKKETVAQKPQKNKLDEKKKNLSKKALYNMEKYGKVVFK